MMALRQTRQHQRMRCLLMLLLLLLRLGYINRASHSARRLADRPPPSELPGTYRSTLGAAVRRRCCR